MPGIVSIKKFGPWAAFLAVPRKARKVLHQAVESTVNKQAQSLGDQIKRTIQSGGAGGPALSPITRAKKGHGTKLVDSNELASSIEVTPAQTNGQDGFVGIPKGRGHRGGLSLEQLAAIHEFGTARIPARPFIGPTLKKFVPKLQKSVIKLWDKSVKGLM